MSDLKLYIKVTPLEVEHVEAREASGDQFAVKEHYKVSFVSKGVKEVAGQKIETVAVETMKSMKALEVGKEQLLPVEQFVVDGNLYTRIAG